jgi:UDP-GlcNAc3NAcA epimerase
VRVATVVGARPQFIKAAPVSHALRARGHEERLLHTGQHYDAGLSQVFFDELDLPAPAVNLEVGSGLPGWQVGTMLVELERALCAWRPDWVLVYGDTNSTLAGALAAAKAGLPLAHVEAGLRSWRRSMPEECNRVLTDRWADLLLCPTPAAVENLAREGIERGVVMVGDTMADAVLSSRQRAVERSTAVADLGLEPGGYLLATVHRDYNTDDPQRLGAILRALDAADQPVVLPLHPRTRARLDALASSPWLDPAGPRRVRLVEPVGYLDMLALLDGARLLLTDSGGLQKEAYLLATPCLTLRGETEWVETVDAGWNQLVDADPARISAGLRDFAPPAERPSLYGDGHAAQRIVDAMEAAQGKASPPDNVRPCSPST